MAPATARAGRSSNRRMRRRWSPMPRMPTAVGRTSSRSLPSTATPTSLSKVWRSNGRRPGTIPAASYDFLGIYVLNSDAVINGVAVSNIDEVIGPDVSGNQRNHAILATSRDVAHGGTGAHTVEIENSTVSNFQKDGIFVNGSTLTANIHDNTIIGAQTADQAQNGIQIGTLFGAVGDGDFSGTHATIDHNTITDVGNQWPGRQRKRHPRLQRRCQRRRRSPTTP